MISPVRPRRMPSGLTSTSVLSMATAASLLAPAPAALRQRDPGRLVAADGRLAVRADLPERLERLAAAHARRLQPRRADRADEVAALDVGAADRALQVPARDPFLHRADLEPPPTPVLQVPPRAQGWGGQRSE